jgi:two-component system, OmpR family, response regulator
VPRSGQRAHGAPTLAQRHKTILVIDDNRDLRESVAEVLELEGYRCWTASSGDDAVRRLREEPCPPDAIVLDLNMPGMSAASFIRQVRGHASWGRVPIGLMTGSPLTDIPLGLPVDLVLLKPFAVPYLLEQLSAALRESHEACSSA